MPPETTMTERPLTEAEILSQVPKTAGRNFTLFVWKHRVAWFVAIVLSMAAFDQVTKIWAQDALAVKTERTFTKNVDGELTKVKQEVFVHRRTVEVVPQAFSFIYRENRAAAFSLTSSIPEGARRPMLLAVSFLAMIFISVWYFRQRRPDGLLMTSFALIISGAIGNFADRVRLGYVVDFINMYAGFINPSWPPWPTYNIADCCIVIGALLVVFRTFRPLYAEDEAGLTVPMAVHNQADPNAHGA